MSRPKYFKQPKSGPDGGLCGFYAARHHKAPDSGSGPFLQKEEFFDTATKIYLPIFGNKDDARAAAEDGNDPAILDQLLGKGQEGPPAFSDLATKRRLTLALTKRPHFIALIKVGSQWMNYDSQLPSGAEQPEPITNLPQFLLDNTASYHWTA